MEEKRLAVHLRDRPDQIRKARNKGIKLIGYFPGNYVPEELIYASEAIPVCLIRGGNAAPAEAGIKALPRVMCPFARAQIGERLLKTNPYYTMMDMLVAPITCQHLKKVAEIWEYYGDLEMFKLGVPQQHNNGFELEYFADRLKALKDRLQLFTGNEITDTKLRSAIELYNKMRRLLKDISLIRSVSPELMSTQEFFKLNHASFYADPVFMLEILESVNNNLKEKQAVEKADAPRLMLIAPVIADGDNTITDLVKKAGGEIVTEDVFEGLRHYQNSIKSGDDLIQSLAEGYLVDRIPCAFMRDAARKRLDHVLGLVKELNISGIIWYQLLGCETYDAESFYFSEKMAEKNIPMLILEADYGTEDTGQLTTRIGAFIEIVRGVI
jgi:benzoyl-CoA reductase/2-hydroxyglutaryl-CoA dehydratase subunit BcrC/BadD/HgdB